MHYTFIGKWHNAFVAFSQNRKHVHFRVGPLGTGVLGGKKKNLLQPT